MVVSKENERLRISQLSFFCVLLVLLFYIYNTTLVLNNIKVSLSIFSILLGFSLAFIKVLKNNKSVVLTKCYFLFVSIAFFLFIYTTCIETIYSLSGGQYYFSRIVINFFVCSFFCVLFSIYLVKSEVKLSDIFTFIFYIGLVNSVVVLLSFFISDFRLFIESFLYQQEGSNIDYMAVDWRLRGIAAAGGASLSLFTAFCIVIGIICNRMKLISSNQLLVCSIIMLASQFFIARTGLMIGLLFLLLWLFIEFKKFKFSFFILLTVVGVFLAWFYFEFYDQIARILPFALELFYNALSGGSVETSSTNDLLDMLYFPDNINYFFFGFGCFEGCSIYRSDSGYFKSISAVGIFASLFFYLTFFYVLFFWFKRFLPQGVFFWRLMILVLFLVEIKEPFLYQNYLSRALILIVSFAFVQSKILKTLDA